MIMMLTKRERELAAIEKFARECGIVRCPSEHEIAMREDISLFLSRRPLRGRSGRLGPHRYRPPFPAERVRVEI